MANAKCTRDTLMCMGRMTEEELQAEFEALQGEFGNGEGLAIAGDMGLCYYCKHPEHYAKITREGDKMTIAPDSPCVHCGCTEKDPVRLEEIPAWAEKYAWWKSTLETIGLVCTRDDISEEEKVKIIVDLAKRTLER